MSKPHFALLSCSLIVSAFLLPRCSGTQAQHISMDRPEHPFFAALTSRPMTTMVWTILGTAVSMFLWGSRLRRDYRRAYKQTPQEWSKIALALLSVTLFSAILLLLLGTPTSITLNNLAFGSYMSLLVFLPITQVYGIPSLYSKGFAERNRLSQLLVELRPDSPLQRTLLYPAVGCVIGAWLGALPIPLDWDRPWQSYPLTPTWGALLGYISAGLLQ